MNIEIASVERRTASSKTTAFQGNDCPPELGDLKSPADYILPNLVVYL